MAGPGFVNGFQANGPFRILRILFGAFHDFVASLKQSMALAFDHPFVFVEEKAGIEMAALGAALEHVAIGSRLNQLAVIAEAADRGGRGRWDGRGGPGVARVGVWYLIEPHLK